MVGEVGSAACDLTLEDLRTGEEAIKVGRIRSWEGNAANRHVVYQ